MPNRCCITVDGNRATSPKVKAPSAASERSRRLPTPASSLTGRSAKNSCSRSGGTSTKPGLAALVASFAIHVLRPNPAETGSRSSV